MSLVHANILRIEGDVADPYRAPVNKINGQRVVIPRAKDIRFEIGLRSRGTWLESITDISSILIEVWDASTHITLRSLFVSSASITTCAEGSWNDDTSQHCVIEATSTDTAALVAAASGTQYWLVISAVLAGGEKVTIAAGTIEALEDGGQYAGAVPAPGNPVYPTRDEVAALILGHLRDWTVESPNGTYRGKVGIDNNGQPKVYLS